MRYTKRTVKESIEKNIVSALITNTNFIKEIINILDKSLLNTPYAKTITGWCLDFYDKAKIAPEDYIHSIFEEKKDTLEDSLIEGIEQFLNSIDNNIQNIPYLVEQTEKYLNLRKMEKLNNELNMAINNEDVPTAQNIFNSFVPISRPTSDGIDVFDKDKVIKILFEDNLDFLFRLKGDLGSLLHDFNRGDFVTFIAPAKRGKSNWLLEMGKQALRNSLNVIFVSLEMPEKAVLKRFYTMLTGKTFKKKEEGKIIDVPYFDENTIEYKEHEMQITDSEDIQKKIDRMVRGRMRGGRMIVHAIPSSSVNTIELNNYLDLLEQNENFIADVIIVDYADLMNTPYGYAKEGREKSNQIWTGLRAMAQERHSLVVTASHANKATFSRSIEEGDISEDIRKINHATCAIALNQTREDKGKGIMRVSLLFHRYEECNANNEIIVLQQLNTGKVNIDSRWKTKILNV